MMSDTQFSTKKFGIEWWSEVSWIDNPRAGVLQTPSLTKTTYWECFFWGKLQGTIGDLFFPFFLVPLFLHLTRNHPQHLVLFTKMEPWSPELQLLVSQAAGISGSPGCHFQVKQVKAQQKDETSIP